MSTGLLVLEKVLLEYAIDDTEVVSGEDDELAKLLGLGVAVLVCTTVLDADPQLKPTE